MMTNEFRRLHSIAGWLVWAVATIAYCSTIEPTASFWDCGEYIACAYKLEVGHPPGAPFFLLLGRFFTLLAGGDPALAGMMVNIMSALSSSFTILFLFWTISRIAIRIYGNNVSALSKIQQWVVIMAAAIGSLAYTFSDSFWFSAVEGEVYAMSSFFTAVVFWAILRWDEEDSHNPVGALRWLVLISYLVGLSIGVHLLNLLVIPAIGFIIYYKKYKFSWKGFIYAGIVSVLVLGFVQTLLIPKIVKFISDYEVFFTNKMNLPYSSGTLLFFVLLLVSLTLLIRYTIDKNAKYYRWGFYSAIALSAIAVITAPSGSGMFFRIITLGGILYGINKIKTKTVTLNAIFLSFATLLIGYSSFFILVIRSQANPPMDENDPENAPNMLSYLLREQYGDWPLLYGQYYNAPQRSRREFGSGDPIYAKDKVNGNYKVVDDRKFSVAKYEKEFCTVFPRMYSPQSHHEAGYKYWGNVSDHHRNKLIEGRNGEPETVEVPTMAANLTYFFRYQINYMYLRYLYWNFVGRQNDIQGTTGNNMDGNWVSGIGPLDDFRLDYDTSNPIYRDKNNFAHNQFFALPLLLGIFGMIFHFKRHKPDAWVVLSFFLLTGLAIVIYLNQTPYQPRERDYAYTGSFYAFAIWIGIGVMWLFDALSKRMAARNALIAATAISLIIPGIMAAEGWNDHNRSLRTLSRDVAINYLQSCAPNAILFTNGDNDTFPLWYAQEVEGVRTDVRVVNLSLLQTDWYIRQMRRAAYESAPVPFTIPEEKLEAEKMSYLLINSQSKTPMSLKEALAMAISDDPNTKYDTGSDLLDIIPTSNLYIDIDSASVMKNKVISDTARLARRISWDLGERSYITKNDLMVLDLIANNNWERPIYFAVTTGDEAYVGLKKYFQLEGLAYRFVPVRQTPDEESLGGRVNTDAMFDNIMNRWYWGGMDKPGVNLDENCMRMAGNLRMQMGILAAALLSEGKTNKAKQVLDKCLEVMPEHNIPYDAAVFSICAAYYEVKENGKANELAKKLFDIYEGDLRIYNAQKPHRRNAYGRDISQAKEILRRLTSLTQQYRQEELYNEFMKRMPGVMGPEDYSEQPPSQLSR
jgi:tetratricopeptide (TPR) repeat protein